VAPAIKLLALHNGLSGSISKDLVAPPLRNIQLPYIIEYVTGYSDAIVHAFRKFRAPLSVKAEHAFPVRVQEYKSIFCTQNGASAITPISQAFLQYSTAFLIFWL